MREAWRLYDEQTRATYPLGVLVTEERLADVVGAALEVAVDHIEAAERRLRCLDR
jgi:hypothetical protein